MGIQIHELATKSGNLSSSDFLVVDNGTVTAKIDYTKLAKAIVEQYNGSTLAGSAQTLQNALNGLNTNTENMYTKTGTVISSDGEDLNTYWTMGKYYCQSSARAQTLQNCPTDAGFSLYVIRRTTGGGTQLIEDNVGELYIRYNNTNGSTTAWQPWRSITKSDALEASFANYGCKNLLSPKNASATHTVNGVTFTMNGDGSVKVSGTATAEAIYTLISSSAKALGLASGRYTLSGGSSNVTMQIQYNGTWLSDTGNAPSFTYNSASTASDLARLIVGNGKTVNETIYPMIRSASIPDDTYVPYASNNAKLDATVIAMKGTLPNGTDLDNATTPGVYLISGSNSYTHCPAGYGMLEVLKRDLQSNITLQRLTNNDGIWFRYYGGSSWIGGWKKVTHTAV